MSVSISGDTGISKVQDGVIDAASLGAGSVTTAKIADSNVTTAKIADSNVTTAKIADANVTVAKISATGTPSSSTFLRGDGSWQSAGGGQLQVVVFASTTTWTCPAGVTKIYAGIVGGGAGGAGFNSNVGYSAIGGAGGVDIGHLTVVPGTVYTVTIGAGGAGTSNGNASGAGGESWFGVNSASKLLSATGGGSCDSYNPTYNGANGAGTLGSLSRGASLSAVGVFSGISGRSQVGQLSQAAVAWGTSSIYIPGSRGEVYSWLDYGKTFFAGQGGVGGAMFIQYVG